jgi:hypothetical protein
LLQHLNCIQSISKIYVILVEYCMKLTLLSASKGSNYYKHVGFLRVRRVSFTSRAKGCIKFVPHSCLVSLSHKVGVFLEEAICYFIYSKFAVMLRLSINTIVLNHVNSDHVPSFSCLDVWISRQTTSGVYAITVTSAYHSRRCGRL